MNAEIKDNKVVVQGSKPGTLDKDDLIKLGKGFLLAIAGAIIAVTITFMGSITETVDFGIWAPMMAALASVVINFLRKWSADNKIEIDQATTSKPAGSSANSS